MKKILNHIDPNKMSGSDSVIESILLNANNETLSTIRWHIISGNKRISIEFIDRWWDRFAWDIKYIINRDDLTLDFMIKHPDVFQDYINQTWLKGLDISDITIAANIMNLDINMNAINITYIPLPPEYVAMNLGQFNRDARYQIILNTNHLDEMLELFFPGNLNNLANLPDKIPRCILQNSGVMEHHVKQIAITTENLVNIQNLSPATIRKYRIFRVMGIAEVNMSFNEMCDLMGMDNGFTCNKKFQLLDISNRPDFAIHTHSLYKNSNTTLEYMLINYFKGPFEELVFLERLHNFEMFQLYASAITSDMHGDSYYYNFLRYTGMSPELCYMKFLCFLK